MSASIFTVNAQAPSMLANNKEKTKSINEKILNDIGFFLNT